MSRYHGGTLPQRQAKVRIGQEQHRAIERISRLESKLARIRELERMVRDCDLRGFDAVQRTLRWYWSIHPCGTCGSHGACTHREPEVDIARINGMALQLRGAA